MISLFFFLRQRDNRERVWSQAIADSRQYRVSHGSVLERTWAHKRMVCGEKGGKTLASRLQDKSLSTETRSAEKGEEEGTWCCFFSFGFVAVVPNTKLAKRYRYLSKTLSDSLMINHKPFSMYLQLILLLPCVTTLFILPSQKKEMNSR